MAGNGLPQGFSLDQSTASDQSGSSPPPGFQLDEDKYGTAGQQAIAGLEGAAEGLAGPLAPAAEIATGLATPEEIRGRAEQNPWTHGLGEAAGFGAGAFLGTGEAAAVGKIGELAGAGLEGASTISKIASAGIKTGAEMAALQGSNEISKLVTQDPNQSLGSAAINIGLSGLLGTAGGSVLGAVSPLWQSSVEKLGIPKIIDDAKAQYNFRQSLPNGGDVPSAITDELSTRLNEMDNLRSKMGELKGDSLEKAMPEITDENTSKIDGQLSDTVDAINNQIKSIQKTNNPYLQGVIPKLEFHRDQLLATTEEGFNRSRPIEIEPATPKIAQQEVSFTPIRIDENPARSAFPWLRPEDAPPTIVAGDEQLIQHKMLNQNPSSAVRMTPIEWSGKSYLDKFSALDSLKRDFQGLVNYERNSSEDSAIASIARPLAYKIRSGLEDQNVWGDAGSVQKNVNAALKSSIDAEKDALGKFTQKSNLEGGKIVDPAKVQSLVNQSLKGKAGLKGDFIQNYLDQTNDLADTINKIHTDYGLDAPIRLSPTPALDHTLGRSSPGTTLGNWLYDKGLASLAGHTGAEAVGAGLGTAIGHPAIGALVGERMLAPTFTSLARPLLEKASSSAAFKGALDYVGNVIRGQKILSQALENVFRSQAEILPRNLIPDSASREKLKNSFAQMDDMNQAQNIGAGISHYLPDHTTAAGAMGTAAKQVLSPMKPTQPQSAPIDKPLPVNNHEMKIYERGLDIAQQPLMVLKHINNGTLRPSDVQILNSIYPSLHKTMAQGVYNQILSAKNDGKDIPYHQLQSASLLIGAPMRSTMSQPVMASIMMANAPKSAPQPTMGKQRKISASTSRTMDKSTSLLKTPEQARESGRYED